MIILMKEYSDFTDNYESETERLPLPHKYNNLDTLKPTLSTLHLHKEHILKPVLVSWFGLAVRH